MGRPLPETREIPHGPLMIVAKLRPLSTLVPATSAHVVARYGLKELAGTNSVVSGTALIRVVGPVTRVSWVTS